MLDLYQGFRLILSWLISGYAQLLETEMLHSSPLLGSSHNFSQDIKLLQSSA